MLIENQKKDLIIRQIKTKIEEKNFLRFEKKLSKECFAKLNSIGNSQKEDSTFIAIALNGLYDDNTEIIKQKNLSGRSRNGVKSQITPEKKNILEQLFAERLSFMNEDVSRQIALPKLIRNAIDNARRKEACISPPAAFK